jgi:hypothetical protein
VRRGEPKIECTRRPSPDPDALLVALVLVPETFSRNRFFRLYEDPATRRIRRRAARVRGVIRQLLGTGRAKAELLGEAVMDDGRVLLRFRVQGMSFERTTALSALEAATLRYALNRAGAGTLEEVDRRRVESALAKLTGVDVSAA